MRWATTWSREEGSIVWFKAIGAALLIVSSAGLGYVASQTLEDRLRIITDLRSGLWVLETEISFGATPLCSALERVRDTIPGKASSIFDTAAMALRAKKGITAQEALVTALMKSKNAMPIAPPEIEILQTLSSNIGGSDANDQIRHIRLATERLRLLEEKVALSVEKNSRLYRLLGLLGGVALALVIV